MILCVPFINHRCKLATVSCAQYSPYFRKAYQDSPIMCLKLLFKEQLLSHTMLVVQKTDKSKHNYNFYRKDQLGKKLSATIDTPVLMVLLWKKPAYFLINVTIV